jgi:purine-nucleoside phosphorylase
VQVGGAVGGRALARGSPATNLLALGTPAPKPDRRILPQSAAQPRRQYAAPVTDIAPDADSPTPAQLATTAAQRIAELTGAPTHDVALVIGSGWLPAADALGTPDREVAATDVPGFAASGVIGHAGTIRSVRVGERGDRRVLVLAGRTHLYEGRGVRAVVHGVRAAAAAGCRAIVLTNGCGSLDPTWRPGTPVLIRDHINLTATSPIEGANFVDLTDLYSPRLRALCREIDPGLDEGVYVQFRGPHYETPAEIAMVRAIGGSLVGMSTVLEAIAAREAGLEVLGISLVTNLAAGIGGEPLNHEEVLRAGRDAASRMGELLGSVLPRI